ncbi:unnamed protein product [Angiostrongylus costaricensis]|uniref:Endo/exonuclease/phosphatase domain-containing protein n=1 Tax=Angiostrongylus costaricensis TaxID=334426 RepID=A0A0R3PWN1_ANGCS|nr:unnamed protein product [Angiostrongylus costaricensis]
MTVLRRPDGTVTASRKAMEKVIHDYYSDLFNSHVLLSYEIKEDGYVVSPVLPSEIPHAISPVENRTAPGPETIRPEHLKNLPPVLVNTLARLLTRYLSDFKVKICTYNARTVAFESSIEDLLMQARRTRYDVIGLAETGRRHPFNAVYDTGEELFFGTCGSR